MRLWRNWQTCRISGCLIGEKGMQMNKTNIQRLPNSFFRDNPLAKQSAAMLTYARIFFEQSDSFSHELDQLVWARIDEARSVRIMRERQKIEQVNDPIVWIDMMRKFDVMNRRQLSAKIAAHAEQTVPLLLKKYCTCLQDEFIELASSVLARSDVCYTRTLRELYPQIRGPYAQAHACLTFGTHGMISEIPFLLKQYHRFQCDYPEESFSQFPLLALYLLHEKKIDSSPSPRFR